MPDKKEETKVTEVKESKKEVKKTTKKADAKTSEKTKKTTKKSEATKKSTASSVEKSKTKTTKKAATKTSSATKKASSKKEESKKTKTVTKKTVSKKSLEQSKKPKALYYGTGRRKNAVARVRLYTGKGKVSVNGRDINEYFSRQVLVNDVLSPLKLTETYESFDVVANLNGGGVSGQAGALRHGISRALLNAGNYRESLKKAGYLTRDSRMVERKKYGLKKARKKSQFSKR